MKTMIHRLLPAGLAAFAAMPVLAIEPPKDDAPPPPSVKTPATAPTADPTRRVEIEAKNAYVGLVTAEVPEMLSIHLGLKAGDGILVRELAPDSPALNAGISRYDIITRVGGQSVNSPTEFSRNIASRKPGEEVTLDLIHEGKSITRTVALGTRPANAGRIENPGRMRNLDLDDLAQGLPDANQDRLRGMIEERMKEMMRNAQEMPDLKQDGRGNFRFRSDATVRMMDNDGSVEMKSVDGKKEFTVRDHQNNIVWSGPWDSEQDKAAAPAEVRERIDRLKIDNNFRGNGIRFRLGTQEPDDNETR